MTKILRLIFELGQKFKINILPNHFYSSIPNISELKSDDYWKAPLDMGQINLLSNRDQLKILSDLIRTIENFEFTKDKLYTDVVKSCDEIGYGVIESYVLSGFIRHHKPQKILQVGCGVSTSIILDAVSKMNNYRPEIICIEPYPSKYLEEQSNSGKIKLVQEKAQKVDEKLFTSLNVGDLLFIDSTHTVKVGSEVNRLILEILPKCKSGVFIHFHDIYWPYQYSRRLLESSVFFWNETILLYALLCNNMDFKVLISMSILHYSEKEELKKLITNYNPELDDFGLVAQDNNGKHFPSSIFLQKI